MKLADLLQRNRMYLFSFLYLEEGGDDRFHLKGTSLSLVQRNFAEEGRWVAIWYREGRRRLA